MLRMGENVNDKRVQQVLEIEQKAIQIRDEIIRGAEELPAQAEKEAQALIEKARTDAEKEAQRLLTDAKCEEECADIMSEAEKKVRRIETLALGHFDRAVAFVLARSVGRE